MEDDKKIGSLKELYLAELQEARSVEVQLSNALPKMIEAASAEDLKQVVRACQGMTALFDGIEGAIV